MKSDDYLKLEEQYSWHMLTHMRSYKEDPCIVESGSGSWLSDVSGKRFLDANASMWTSTFGHRDADLDRVLKEQVNILSHSTKVCRGHVPGVLVSEKLAQLTSYRLTRSFFTNNGSTAIESALKMSFQYWKSRGEGGRDKVLSLVHGHHGLSFGVMSLSSIHSQNIPKCLNVEFFSTPEELEDLIDETVACVVMESKVQAIRNRGIHILPEGFIRKVHSICKKKNVHLVLDEVFTGFFRTGSLFACQWDEVFPDFLCLGKGITAGYLPMGVTMTSEDIFNIIDQTTFYHGHTYGGNPLACRVALENIRKLESARDSGFFNQQVHVFRSLFDVYFKDHPKAQNPRSIGMIAAIDLEDGVGDLVCQRAKQQGILIRAYKDTLFFIPALNMSEADINFLFNTISQCIL